MAPTPSRRWAITVALSRRGSVNWTSRGPRSRFGRIVPTPASRKARGCSPTAYGSACAQKWILRRAGSGRMGTKYIGATSGGIGNTFAKIPKLGHTRHIWRLPSGFNRHIWRQIHLCLELAKVLASMKGLSSSRPVRSWPDLMRLAVVGRLMRCPMNPHRAPDARPMSASSRTSGIAASWPRLRPLSWLGSSSCRNAWRSPKRALVPGTT